MLESVDVYEILSFPFPRTAFVPAILLSLNLITSPLGYTPVRVIFAPGSSGPPPATTLLISTSVLESASSIMISALPPDVETAVSPIFTSPFFIVKVIVVARLYPLGCIVSSSVYVPSGRILIVDGLSPETNTNDSPTDTKVPEFAEGN